jgi:hypothetical protein
MALSLRNSLSPIIPWLGTSSAGQSFTIGPRSLNVRKWYILCFTIIGLLFISGLWDYVGNGVLSETQNGKTRVLPNVSGPGHDGASFE